MSRSELMVKELPVNFNMPMQFTYRPCDKRGYRTSGRIPQRMKPYSYSRLPYLKAGLRIDRRFPFRWLPVILWELNYELNSQLSTMSWTLILWELNWAIMTVQGKTSRTASGVRAEMWSGRLPKEIKGGYLLAPAWTLNSDTEVWQRIVKVRVVIKFPKAMRENCGWVVHTQPETLSSKSGVL